MGHQLPAECQEAAAQRDWRCPIAVRTDLLSKAQRRRVARLGSDSRVEVLGEEHTWQLWNAPQLSALIHADSVSGDHEVFITRKQKRDDALGHYAGWRE